VGRGLAAHAPGYARINTLSGSLEYELEADGAIFGRISRRDIADSLRALSDRSKIPTDAEIDDHKTMMRNLLGASVEAARAFSKGDT
jgi:hypothetical protein